jgi:hypothetical protein
MKRTRACPFESATLVACISLARMEQIRQIDELEQFIKAGVGLTRAFRFGRPA